MRGVGTSTVANALRFTPSYDFLNDITQPPLIYPLNANRFEAWLDLYQTALSAHLAVAGTGIIEIDEIAWETEPLPAGTPPTFS